MTEFSLKNIDEVTIFATKIELKLTFNNHDKTLCTKVGQKLCTFLKKKLKVD